LKELSDEQYLTESFGQIDAANQSPTYSIADEHARLCWREGERRKRPDLYDRAFKAAHATAQARQYLGKASASLLGTEC
jgi:hypothetical protein